MKKNVFAVKHAKGDENVPFDGEVFVSRRIDATHQEELDSLSEDSAKHLKKLMLPIPLMLVKFIAFALGILIGVEILTAEVGIAQAYQNAPYFFYIAPALLILAAALQIVEVVRRKQMLGSEEYNAHVDDLESAAKRSIEELGIPADASSIDVLAMTYKEKKDKLVSAYDFTFLPLDMYVYADEKYLYVADNSMVFQFYRGDLGAIERINKKASLAFWNKDDAATSKAYKPYKLTENSAGFVSMKYYYSLPIQSDFGEYELLFPPYEIETVADLLGLSLPSDE